jgi:hypothetical protein
MENILNTQERYTAEEIQRHITSAFDSVNLINELNLLSSLSKEEQSIKQRNVEHLQIMTAREWFAEALTEEQTSIINQLIS